MKKYIAFILIIFLISGFVNAQPEQSETKITINGYTLQDDIEYIINDDVILVPLNYIFDHLNIEIIFPNSELVCVRNNVIEITYTSNSDLVAFNNRTEQLECNVQMIMGYIMCQ